jgi:mono/diheme cytochrome c family protein
MKTSKWGSFGFPLLILLITACSKTSTESRPVAPLVSQGKAVYMSTCIACHNVDPKLPGSVGPNVAGSSYELLYARITKAEYPVGYKPKRNSKMMPALPHLEKDVKALHAYLNSP